MPNTTDSAVIDEVSVLNLLDEFHDLPATDILSILRARCDAALAQRAAYHTAEEARLDRLCRDYRPLTGPSF